MPRSERYKDMSRRLSELRNHMLPASFDPTRPYTPRQLDRILGYRVLAHAEFESCIEDLVADTVKGAWSGWCADRQPRTCLIALVAYYAPGFGDLPEMLTPPQKKKNDFIHLSERIDQARKHHINQVVLRNNGVTEKNLLALLLPVGVQESDIDKTWLATVSSFGRRRGGTAHTSGTTQQPPDPEEELKTVCQIASGFQPIDQLLKTLRES